MTSGGPTNFQPVAKGAPQHWRRPRSFAFVQEMPHVPLSGAEILSAAHHLPVVVEYGRGGTSVVAITDPQLHRCPLTAADGKWLYGPLPIHLQCLPFRLSGGPGEEARLEVAIDPADADHPPQAMFSPDGALSPEVGEIVALLRRLEHGKQLLQRAAKMLLAADVLTFFQPANLTGKMPHQYLTVDRSKFAALSNSRVAHLVRDSFLPLDLAAACILSQRLMPTLIPVATPALHGLSPDKLIQSGIDGLLSNLSVSAGVDDRGLFSFPHHESKSW
jgi:hypothetical protein